MSGVDSEGDGEGSSEGEQVMHNYAAHLVNGDIYSEGDGEGSSEGEQGMHNYAAHLGDGESDGDGSSDSDSSSDSDDDDDDVYFGHHEENHQLRRYGVVFTVIPPAQEGLLPVDGLVDWRCELLSPTSVSVAKDGTIWVTDQGDQRVKQCKVPEKKVEKLKGVISKVMGAFGVVVNIELPLNAETGKTAGFCFVQFQHKGMANEAVDRGNGYKLDKKHIFAIIPMADFDMYMNTKAEWKAPPVEQFEEQANPHWWLMNKHAEDQVVLRHDEDCQVMWMRKDTSSMVREKKRWSDAHPQAPVMWSPRGTYLCTFHRQGIVLSHGKTWAKKRFAHSGVRVIEVSPCETFLVTFSADAPPNKEDPQQIVVWNIKTQEKVRGFLAEPCNPDKSPWPAFKWGPDDSYFARMKHGEHISVYTTKTSPCAMLEDPLTKKKSSVKVKGVQNFAWSPSDNYMAYWTPEIGERPARVSVLKMPEREDITSKNLYQVKDVKLIWQKNGDKLCVYVERWTKSKKQWYTQFLLFHMRNKLVPCDVLEVKEKVEHFAWEPIGSKFAIIQGEGNGRMGCSVYDFVEDKVTKIKTYERVEANTLFWSPRGQHLIIAGVGTGSSGSFKFVDTNDPEATEMGLGQHVNATACEWDPTGRYCSTVVSAWEGLQHDTGYMIWSFQGKPLQRVNHAKFYQLLWRPRPPSLLTTKQIRDLGDNGYKAYAPQFEAEDKLSGNRATGEKLAARAELEEKWARAVATATRSLDDKKARMAAMRPALEDDSSEVVEEIVNVFVREETEIVK